MSSRFLWAWPDAARVFRQPIDAADPDQAARALKKLADLAMPKSEGGDPVPSYVRLDDAAVPVMVELARETQRREQGAHGLMSCAREGARAGAAVGLGPRVPLVVRRRRPGTARVSKRAMAAAAGLMDGYFLPMAARVLGDAVVPVDERNARTLAAWVMAARPARVNVSEIRDTARLSGFRESDAVKAACRFLAEAGWLSSPEPDGKAGPPRGDWSVNPLLFGAAP